MREVSFEEIAGIKYALVVYLFIICNYVDEKNGIKLPRAKILYY